MLRYIVPDVLRTVYGTVEYGAERQEAHARVLGSGTCMRMNQGVARRNLQYITVYILACAGDNSAPE